MKVKIVERYPTPSETLRNYVVEKTQGLERYFERIISVDAVLAVEKERQIADLHAHLTNRKVITAREESPDMYASIDKAIDRLKRQLVKYKDHLHDRGASIPPIQSAPAVETASPTREILRTNMYFQKPMTPEEACLQLDALDKEFFVFINAQTGEVGIVYHRKDGNYGLIEPKH
jgi:putative sigma-54 modulation protein